MESKTPSVNLLKTKGNDFIDRFISWALTIGRMVIILTETIALVAFLYRFILDRQLIDQRDRITQTAAVIKAFQSSEKNYRNLQSRLDIISKVDKQATDQTTMFSDIVNNAPNGIRFNTVTVSTNGIHIDADVQTIGSLTAFVNKMKQNPNILSVSIDKIENKTSDSTIGVGISAKIKSTQIIAGETSMIETVRK
jgi:Tfp pilus assembly protein PilN